MIRRLRHNLVAKLSSCDNLNKINFKNIWSGMGESF